MSKIILNIAGGKLSPIPYPESKADLYHADNSILHLDQMYLDHTEINHIITRHQRAIFKCRESRFDLLCNLDVYEFLERYHIPFDGITMYRFLEHVPKSNVLYFIYLLSTCTEPGAMIDVIVPDYRHLAERILNENPFKLGFESEDIITTYELLNDMPSPHLSIWTDARIKYFFELEGRFKLVKTELDYKFDGRSIYLRSLLKRVW